MGLEALLMTLAPPVLNRVLDLIIADPETNDTQKKLAQSFKDADDRDQAWANLAPKPKQ